jgi:hypothetical protein
LCSPIGKKQNAPSTSCFQAKGNCRHGSHRGRTRHLVLGSRIFNCCRCKALLDFAPSCQPPIILLAGRVQRLESKRCLSAQAPKLYPRPGLLPNISLMLAFIMKLLSPQINVCCCKLIVECSTSSRRNTDPDRSVS